ncbi:MAG: TerB family tellurite resistance protein [Polyangiaceae bacterium]
MYDDGLAVIKALVPMAWADGVFQDKEKEIIDALLDAYHATPAQRDLVTEYAKEKKTLDDIDLQDLSAADRRVVLNHAVLLSFVDGVQGPEEKEFLANLAERLKVPADEAKTIFAAGEGRAKKFLAML